MSSVASGKLSKPQNKLFDVVRNHALNSQCQTTVLRIICEATIAVLERLPK